MKGLQGCPKEGLCNSKLETEASTIKNSKVAVSPDRLLVAQKFIYLRAANRSSAFPALAWMTKHSWHFATIPDRLMLTRQTLR